MYSFLSGDLGYNTGSTAQIVLSLVSAAVVIFVITVLVKRGTDINCPDCGERVDRERLDCPDCGFDFRTVGAPPAE